MYARGLQRWCVQKEAAHQPAELSPSSNLHLTLNCQHISLQQKDSLGWEGEWIMHIISQDVQKVSIRKACFSRMCTQCSASNFSEPFLYFSSYKHVRFPYSLGKVGLQYYSVIYVKSFCSSSFKTPNTHMLTTKQNYQYLMHKV